MKEATLKQGKKTLELIEEVPSERYQRLLGSGLLTILLDCPNPELVDKMAFQQVLALSLSAKRAESLLDFVGTAKIPARAGKFVAKEHFVKDTSKKAKVKISYLGDNFRNNFLGKVEEVITESTLSYRKLKKWSRSIPIINELGGEDTAETSLSEMFGLMEMQPDGKAGTLLTNGYANIFLIRDVNGVLWAVFCSWGDVGWLVGAPPVDARRVWSDGRRVFSRNSSESQS